MERLRLHSEYRFTPSIVEERLRQTTGHSLATWIVGPYATEPKEIAKRKTLEEKHLMPVVTTHSEYKARLAMQARGASVPSTSGIPIIISSGETMEEDDDLIVIWVQKSRCLRSVVAL